MKHPSNKTHAPTAKQLHAQWDRLVEESVDQAIARGQLIPDAKETWISQIKGNPALLDLIDTLRKPDAKTDNGLGDVYVEGRKS